MNGNTIFHEFFLSHTEVDLIKEKEEKKEILTINAVREKKYYCVWGLFALFTLSVCLSTDTGIISTSAAMCLFAVLSILMLPDLLPEMTQQRIIKKYCIAFSIGISVCTFMMRILCTWTDTLMTAEYTYYIEKKSIKGNIYR